MFRKSLVAAVLVATVAPAAAFAAGDTGQFKNQGVDYNYTTEDKNGEKIVRGTAYAGRVPFELHIRKKTVTGTFNNKPVEFDIAEAKKMGLVTGN
ncbi:hypothetical protein Y88_0605 [Novosphingobium nitrogenifigens DSM 19370]|uniref:Uncharacterized protein n=1 Tax=Novosphingobium nitrogenifigens DSM 19370 TaxID=983920 RepID=F1ZA44_9SPHN|nr:hypothetical protein [Novosphingobium nitrogenifigens]EGD58548.1 hypothetical protein Y88_0605 [Novosphingobium nitrogenifigens DSM 19370]